jgi:DNA-binding NtrC family response regulator
MARGTWFQERIRVYKKRIVIRLLRKTGGNVKKAAALIDERRSRLYRIMRVSGIKASDFRGLHADPR